MKECSTRTASGKGCPKALLQSARLWGSSVDLCQSVHAGISTYTSPSKVSGFSLEPRIWGEAGNPWLSICIIYFCGAGHEAQPCGSWATALLRVHSKPGLTFLSTHSFLAIPSTPRLPGSPDRLSSSLPTSGLPQPLSCRDLSLLLDQK